MTLSPNHVHKHGTSTCYIHCRCRCEPCRGGNAKRTRARVRQKAYGRYTHPYVPAEPIRQHVRTLVEFGMGYKQIARLAGVRPGAVQNLLYGRQQPGPRYRETLKNVSSLNAEKLLQVLPDHDSLALGARVRSLPTVRKLRALVALGWSQSQLSTRLGMTPGNLGKLLNSRQCTLRTERAVNDLYDKLSATPPPQTTHAQKIAASRSRRYAADRGWPLPMDWAAYDDDFTRRTPPRRSAA